MEKTAEIGQGMQKRDATKLFCLDDKSLEEIRRALGRVFSGLDTQSTKDNIVKLKAENADLEADIRRLQSSNEASRAAASIAGKAIVADLLIGGLTGGMLGYSTGESIGETKRRIQDEQNYRIDKLEGTVTTNKKTVAVYCAILSSIETVGNRLPVCSANELKALIIRLVTVKGQNLFADLCCYFRNTEEEKALRYWYSGNDRTGDTLYNRIMENAGKEAAIAPFVNADDDEKKQWAEELIKFEEIQRQYRGAYTMRTHRDAVAKLEAMAGIFDISEARKEADEILETLKPEAYKRAKTNHSSDSINLAPRIRELKTKMDEFELLGDYEDSAEQKAILEQAVEEEYRQTSESYSSATSGEEYGNVAKRFAALGDYKDSAALLKAAEEKKKDCEYTELCDKLDKLSRENTLEGMYRLRDGFRQMNGYKESAGKGEQCEREIERLEREQEEKELLEEKKKKKQCLIIAGIVVAVIFVIIFVLK